MNTYIHQNLSKRRCKEHHPLTHKTGTHSTAGKQTPRSPIPMRAPRATAIRRRTELLAVILYIQLYYIIYFYI